MLGIQQPTLVNHLTIDFVFKVMQWRATVPIYQKAYIVSFATICLCSPFPSPSVIYYSFLTQSYFFFFLMSCLSFSSPFSIHSLPSSFRNPLSYFLAHPPPFNLLYFPSFLHVILPHLFSFGFPFLIVVHHGLKEKNR